MSEMSSVCVIFNEFDEVALIRSVQGWRLPRLSTSHADPNLRTLAWSVVVGQLGISRDDMTMCGYITVDGGISAVYADVVKRYALPAAGQWFNTLLLPTQRQSWVDDALLTVDDAGFAR